MDLRAPTAPSHHEWATLQLRSASGVVLDLGAGRGALARILPADATWIALEPAAPSSLRRLVGNRVDSQLLECRAETMELGDGSVDQVVCLTTLCSVDDPGLCVHEVARVLKPGGRFLFSEHVAAPRGTPTRALQSAIRPFTTYLDKGCNPCRHPGDAISQADFTSVEMTTIRARGAFGPVLRGIATR